MNELLWELVSAVQSAAPELWRIARQQVQVEIMRQQIGAGLSLAVLVTAIWTARWGLGNVRRIDNANEGKSYRNQGDADGYIAAVVVSGLTAIAMAIVLFCAVVSWASMSANPDYYAIAILRRLATGMR